MAEVLPVVCAACSSRAALSEAPDAGAQPGAEAAEGQQPCDDQPAPAADGEDGDEGGQADDGQGSGEAGDVLAVGAERKGAAADGRLALGPGLPGGEEDDGGAGRPEEQAGGQASAASCAVGRGGGSGTGLGYGDSTHVLHYPLPAQQAPRRFAVCTARRTAAALFRHSVSSATGSESATMPAPAWTYAVPSRSRAVRMAMAVSESPAKSR